MSELLARSSSQDERVTFDVSTRGMGCQKAHMLNYLCSDLDRKAPTTVGRPFDSRQTATIFLTPIKHHVLRMPDLSSESHPPQSSSKGQDLREAMAMPRGGL
ncbi:hypothetical protein PSHT_09292 [Puccinia striiformis]|uniref:Uncharacterized protein n=1 Tax=Puccinia striiformis TaxID=27350 RepID=A0A2S4VHR3_9BASI|nr:hypothetical protein PSHT_09292 [Puccinia striiformis]